MHIDFRNTDSDNANAAIADHLAVIKTLPPQSLPPPK